MYKLGLFLLLIIVFKPINLVLAGDGKFTDGIWFRCEFAHSQIPPGDDCLMLDDDGFQVIKGFVYHVKVLNSLEARCRQNKVGHCFLKTQKGLIASRSQIGKIQVISGSLSVEWFACRQKYALKKFPGFVEVIPIAEFCWWTSNKRYFVSRYNEPIKFEVHD